MTTAFQKVKTFMDTFEMASRDTPGWPHVDNLNLWANLVGEEFHELQYAVAEGDLNEIAKEAADLLYVVYGLGYAFGFPMDEVFSEVHRSNMSKLTVDGKVLRRADGKVLKSDQYTPADIDKVLGVTSDPLNFGNSDD